MASFLNALLSLVVLAHVAITHNSAQDSETHRFSRGFPCLIMLTLAIVVTLSLIGLLLVLTLLTAKGGP